MNVQVRNMSIPLEFTVKCNEVLNDLIKAHNKEMDLLDQKLRMAGPTETIVEQRRALKEKGKRLTIQHLLRACLMAGASVLDGKPADIMARMAADTVKVGRPSGTRAA
jgi:hypothetical protein